MNSRVKLPAGLRILSILVVFSLGSVVRGQECDASLFTIGEDCNRNGFDDSCETGPHFVSFALADALEGSGRLVTGDLDADGDTDLLAIGSDVRIWHNDAGRLVERDLIPVRLGNEFSVLADLDGDGRPELLAGDVLDERIAILFNDGSGFFSGKTIQFLDLAPRRLGGLDAGDLDRDGDADLLVTYAGREGLEILENLGEMRFESAWTSGRVPTGGSSPPRALLGDLDADGDLDLLTRGFESRSTISVHENLGDGTLVKAIESNSSDYDSNDVHLADVNGDARLDLVLGHPPPTEAVSVILQQKDGRFSARPVVTRRLQLALVMDLNADGWPDAIGRSHSALGVLFGTPFGVFAPMREFPDVPFPRALPLTLLAVLNVDLDARPELVIVSNGRAEIYTNSPGPLSSDCNQNARPDECEIAAGELTDCDGSGIPDECELATGELTDCDGNGVIDVCEITETLLRFTPEEPRASPGLVRSVDLDLDGDVDLVVASPDRGTRGVTVYRNDGSGRFSTAQRLELGEISDLAAVDLDGDGDPDFVLAGPEDSTRPNLVILENRAGYLGLDSSRDGGAHVDVADLDGDGQVDLVTTRVRDVLWLRGLGNGTFEPARSLFTSDLILEDLDVVDLDGDGALDLAVAPGLLLYQRDRFVFEEVLRVLSPTRLIPVDVDRDGNVDLVHHAGGTPSLARNLGSGVFAERVLIEGAPSARQLLIVDIDEDGFEDLLLSTPGGGAAVGWNDRGSFGSFQSLPAPPAGAADLDTDGDIDFFGFSGSRFWLLRQLAPREFSGEEDRSVSGTPRSSVVLDHDGDGRADLAVSSTEEIAIFHGSEGVLSSTLRHPMDRAIGRLQAGDLDGDGRDELLVSDAVSGSLWSIRGRPAGSAFDSYRVPFDESKTSFRVLDLDRDGALDLLGARFADPAALILRRGRGDGSFDEPQVALLGLFPTHIVDSDLDRDGDLDLVLVSGRELLVATQLPAGEFFLDSLGEFSIGSSDTFPVAVADIDGDGTVELVIAGSGIWTRDGTTYVRNHTPEILSNTTDVYAADLDGDGMSEIIAYRPGDTSVRVSRNISGELLEVDPLLFDGGLLRAPIALADFDDDNDLDVSAVAGGLVQVLLNVTRPRSASDCDDDGEPDICEPDCDENGIPDDCELRDGVLFDCDSSGVPDSCELRAGILADCDSDGTPDLCEIASGAETDENSNLVPDTCERGLQRPGDCTQDGLLDVCDAVCLLGGLFLGEPPLFPCGEGLPTSAGTLRLLAWDDSDRLTITDAIAVLRFLFLSGSPHPLAAEDRNCVPIFECPDVAACSEPARRSPAGP